LDILAVFCHFFIKIVSIRNFPQPDRHILSG
jgi:hypothetical protein